MDRTDIAICLRLLSNSRTPYHELADELGLSINAIHKRIKAMTEEGIIRAYTARINIPALRAISVWIFGRSEASPLDDVHVELRKDDSTYWVAYSGGGYIYVGGFLPGISKLEQYVAFVKKGAQIVDPTVGIGNSLPFHDEELSPLDYRIIRVLHKDARKPVSEVATELGITARTVQRRLERMLQNSLLDLSIDWYPDASNDIISLCHVRLLPAADKVKVGTSLIQQFAPNLLFNESFSNLPSQLISFLWTNTMKELRGIRERIRKVEGIESTMLNILYTGFIFDTWRDKLALERGQT